jgi:hypothetical protein
LTQIIITVVCPVRRRGTIYSLWLEKSILFQCNRSHFLFLFSCNQVCTKDLLVYFTWLAQPLAHWSEVHLLITSAGKIYHFTVPLFYQKSCIYISIFLKKFVGDGLSTLISH